MITFLQFDVLLSGILMKSLCFFITFPMKIWSSVPETTFIKDCLNWHIHLYSYFRCLIKLFNKELKTLEKMYFWIICSIVVGYFLYKVISDFFSPIHQIPEPPGHFILGHLPEFMKKQDSITLMTKWGEQFKEYGMYKLRTLTGEYWR